VGSSPGVDTWMESGREAGLVLSAQQGSVESYWELMEHYGRPLYRMAFALTRDREQAGLTTLSALVQGWKNLKHLPVGRPYLPWMLRNLRALVVGQRRRGEAGAGAKPEAPLRGRAAAVHGAFLELSIDEQMIIALSVMERLSYGAIGHTLDLPAHKALSRLSAARERLRARVAARLGGDA